MSYPWQGAARPMPPDAYGRAATRIGCSEAAVQAVFSVESAKRGFLKDGSLIRRFEPHHMPGSDMTWRDSLKIGPTRRDQMLKDAFAREPNAALRASSWGGPQIMGFNAHDAGFASARDMVEAMADDEEAHLTAFVDLVLAWGLDGSLRAHDWQTFASRYNGSGQPEVYARKIEAAYRRFSGGDSSPVVLRLGDRGAAVKRLQAALGIEEDGSFGPQTESAVRAFQERAGLQVDGIVGMRTWSALEQQRDAKPKAQETAVDAGVRVARDWVVKGGTGGGIALSGQAAVERAPQGAIDLAFYGGVGLVLLAVAAVGGGLVWKWWRQV